MESNRDKQREIEERTGRPAPQRAHQAGGPSPLNEIDEAALGGAKSDWQERSAPAAGDPASEAELNGLSLLGGSDPRGDGSLGGVSDPVRDGSAGPRERGGPEITAAGAGGRKNPPLMEDAGMGDGGISVAGGAAGGARGHAGTSNAGAGGPLGDTAGGPSQHNAASRFDLGHPDTDVGDDEGDTNR